MRVLLLCAALAGIPLAGCSPPGWAQTATSTTAHALDEVDESTAGLYERRATTCRDASADWPAYDACMVSANRAEEGLRATDRWLRAAQRALDTWRDGGEEDWPGVAACLASAMSLTLDGLAALDVDVPDQLIAAIRLVSGVAGTCEAP